MIRLRASLIRKPEGGGAVIEGRLAMGRLGKAAATTFLVLLAAELPAWAQSLTRGPYLQQGGTSRVTIRWRTSSSVVGRVRWGNSPTNLSSSKDETSSRTEHEVAITGLAIGTKYYYSIGSATATLAGGDANHYFVTHPTVGVAKAFRAWVIGDAGTATSSQRAVRDAYYSFAGSTPTDLWFQLGDNAYSDGTDSEYQAAVFNMYPTLLRNSVTWSTLGNHDGHSASSGTQSGPYYDIFTLPKNAESGGVASGTEAYYSFDYANVHFICLDSYDTSRSTSGAMANWLRNDLAATAQEWIVAYWHHPPYTKGSHNSDSESALIEMRTNFLPILENAGVDLVLCGHSHSYERSFLLDGHYGSSSTFTSAHKKDGGSGRDANPYRKPAGLSSHQGAVYSVVGSSGKTSGGSLNHPAMYISLNQLGSMVLDFNGGRLDAKFLRETGAVGDYFTIQKGASSGDTTKPVVTIESPTTSSTYTTASTPLALGGTATDNVGVTQVTWTNSAGGSGTATGTSSWTASVALVAGTNTITVTARDAAGNTGTDTITVTYTPPPGDSVPPTITISSPSSNPYTSSTDPLVVSGGSSDGGGVASVTWSNATTGDAGTASGTTTWTATIPLAAGTNNITITVVDTSGNTTSTNLTVIYNASSGGGGGGGGGWSAGDGGPLGDWCGLATAAREPVGMPSPWLALLVVLALLPALRRR
jgi:hypothetical protein